MVSLVTPIQMPPESGGICGRLTYDLPLGCLQGGGGGASGRATSRVLDAGDLAAAGEGAQGGAGGSGGSGGGRFEPEARAARGAWGGAGGAEVFFLFFSLVTGPRRSLGLKLSDTRVYEPEIRARLGTTAHFSPADGFLVEITSIRDPSPRTPQTLTPSHRYQVVEIGGGLVGREKAALDLTAEVKQQRESSLLTTYLSESTFSS